MSTKAEINYADLNFRISTSAHFINDISAGYRLATEPKDSPIPYFDSETNLVTFFVIPTYQNKQEPIYPDKLTDPLAKYRALIHKIDFSEVGTEKEKIEEEMRIYFDMVDYRKRATTLFID